MKFTKKRGGAADAKCEGFALSQACKVSKVKG